MAGPGAKKKKRASAARKAPPSPKRTVKKPAKRASAKKAPQKAAPKKAKKAVARAKQAKQAKPSPKKKAPPKARKIAAPKAKLEAKPKAKAAPSKSKNGAPPRSSAPPAPMKRSSQPPLAGERVLAACAALPVERSLTDEERAAMSKVAETARRFVGVLTEAPEDVVERIAGFVDEVRGGVRPEPRSQDVRLGLGVLWGEQLRVSAGWRWVHLTYPDGFASYALVPDDRAFACFPLNRVPEAMRDGRTNTSARVFDSIRSGALPSRRANSYLVIG